MTLHWPPAPEQLTEASPPIAGYSPEPDQESERPRAQSPAALVTCTELAGAGLPLTGLTDPRLIGGVAEITAMIAAQLDDGASAAEVMPVRAGLLPAAAGSALDDLATGVQLGLARLAAEHRDCRRRPHRRQPARRHRAARLDLRLWSVADSGRQNSRRSDRPRVEPGRAGLRSQPLQV